MFNDLSLVSPKRGMGYSKKKRKERKDGMPKKHDPKKKEKEKYIWTHEGLKKEKNSIAMSSYYPNRRERDP